jgi:hypothetical protein
MSIPPATVSFRPCSEPSSKSHQGTFWVVTHAARRGHCERAQTVPSYPFMASFPAKVALPPPMYTMCSREECDARQRTREVSVFEATAETVAGAPNLRKIDPRRAVAKYRRSAAGFTDQDRPPARSRRALIETVDYLLLDVFATQTTETLRSNTDVPPHSLTQTLQFVEDRIRAVQVELVWSQQSSKRIQVRLTRAQILMLYLTLDDPAYPRIFGQKALTTALATYWLSQDDLFEHTEESASTHDEMLALQSLHALAENLQTESFTDGVLSTTVLVAYRRHVLPGQPLPLFQWTLKLLSNISLGLWRIALDQLVDKKATVPFAFATLARCLMAPCLSYMRYQALQVYNVSFGGKVEGIPGTQLAPLLCFSEPLETKSACHDVEDSCYNDAKPGRVAEASRTALCFAKSVGLPVEQDSVLFKTATLKALPHNSGGRDDEFVLGIPLCQMPQAIASVNGVRLPPMSWIRGIILSDFSSLVGPERLTSWGAATITSPCTTERK